MHKCAFEAAPMQTSVIVIFAIVENRNTKKTENNARYN
jgi:hypothetical protein